jgi:hypothetical protein
MTRDAVPSAIVAQLVEAARELERWVEIHRTAIFAWHEQGCWPSFGGWGRLWVQSWRTPWGWIRRPRSRSEQPVRVVASDGGRMCGTRDSRWARAAHARIGRRTGARRASAGRSGAVAQRLDGRP